MSYNTQCRSVIPKIRLMSSYLMLLLIVIVFKHAVLSMCLLQCELSQNSEKYGSWAVPISAAASVFLSHDCLKSLSCGQAQKFSSFLILDIFVLLNTC